MAAASNVLQFDPVNIKADLEQPQPKNYDKLLLGLLPFTPVQFTGKDALLAWGRLAGYSLIAYYTYNKMRPLSYIAIGAAVTSLATSLSGKMWEKKS
jgi:hypothetical protein